MDSFFDWRLGVRSSRKQLVKSITIHTIWREALCDYETTNNDTQSTHDPHVTASENTDEEADENVEEQSARFESDEGEEEVYEFVW